MSAPNSPAPGRFGSICAKVPLMITGSIDKLTPQGAIGWLYRQDLVEPAKIRAFLNNEVIGETMADGYRSDLHQVGLGDGKCGFDMKFTRPIIESQLPFVKIKPDSIDLSLSLTSKSVYLDVLHAVLADAHGTGRNRSILGGLWTDRTDAAQIVAGRVAVGSCMGELQPVLQELIANGFVVLPGVLAPSGLTRKDAVALDLQGKGLAQDADRDSRLREALDTLAKLLFRDAAVRLLRAVFDDHPVIYRVDKIEEEMPFRQAVSIEALPSPAESLMLYVGFPGGSSRLEFIRESHEMAEFGPSGRSRWTAEGAGDLGALAQQDGLSIGEAEFGNLDIVIVSPGLVHRVSGSSRVPVLSALVTPRRITPLRFLSGGDAWVEASHVSGARIRIDKADAAGPSLWLGP